MITSLHRNVRLYYPGDLICSDSLGEMQLYLDCIQYHSSVYHSHVITMVTGTSHSWRNIEPWVPKIAKVRSIVPAEGSELIA